MGILDKNIKPNKVKQNYIKEKKKILCSLFKMSQVDAGTLVRPSKRSRSTSSATDRAAEARSTTVKDVKQDEKLKKIEKALKGLKPELKYKDYAHNAVVDYNGTIYDISSTVAQGTTDSTRIGDALVIK
uniref:hypothetical protein n=1 Tax=Rheinheimera sp. TaxID=1869214 RepID=UPI004047A688